MPSQKNFTVPRRQDKFHFRAPDQVVASRGSLVCRIALILLSVVATALAFVPPVHAAASLTITPITWDVIGLDSNKPTAPDNDGPVNFPVGARVCNTGDAAATNVTSALVWDSANTYIDFRPGTLQSFTGSNAIASLAAGTCTDFYYEIEIDRDTAAYDTARQYRITADSNETSEVATPTGRQLYVEHLVSQNRNGITSIALDGAPIAPGGAMTLIEGNTYTITLSGFTATNGYEQLESFINFKNTVFKLNSVSTTYTADTSPTVDNPNSKLYADGCTWDNNPASGTYNSCLSTGKAGGNVVMTYNLTVIGGGGTSETLYSLLYDFSGSSFHYNGDFETNFVIANIVDPDANIAKSFNPTTTVPGGTSVMTITITNPIAAPISSVNFTDTFPSDMVVATPATYSTTGCGSPTFAPTAGAASISFSNGTILANGTCTINVTVTAPSAVGTFTNTTGHLFIGTTDTNKTASADITTTTLPPPVPPSTCLQKVEIARWSMAPAAGTSVPPAYTSKVGDVSTATAAAGLTGQGVQSIATANGNPVNSWAINDDWHVSAPGGANAPYFQFLLDTSKYGGITITFDALLDPNGSWANQANHAYVYTSENGGAYSLLSTITISKGSWQSALNATNTSSGTSTTAFRLLFDSRNPQKTRPGDDIFVYLDNIVFTGCPVPPNPPTITKNFSPDPIAVGANSMLTFTLTNPNTSNVNTNNTLTGVAFSDTLPSGVVIASPLATSNTCGGTLTATAGGSVISLSSGSILANSSCTITVEVTGNSAGTKNNVSGYISSTETGTNSTSTGYATDTLTVIAPPTIEKSFSPDPIVSGGTSTLTFVLTNSNPGNALSSVAFLDTFPTSPAAMVVANPTGASTTNCGSPTFSPTAGSGSISFTGGTIAAGGTCVVKVNVTAPTNGTYNNTSDAVTHVLNSTTYGTDTASDSLVVNTPTGSIVILKQVATSASGPWRSSLTVTTGTDLYYRFLVVNTGDIDLYNLSITDPEFGNPSVCSSFTPNSNPPASVPPLPVASQTNDPAAYCTRGPVDAVVGTHTNTAYATGTNQGNTSTFTSNNSTAAYTAQDPTSAELVAFNVGLVEKGIRVKWETAGEMQIVGFNVWRKNGKREWKQVNAELINAKNIGTVTGAKYSFIDKSAKPNKVYRYKLEIATISGESKWSDIVRVK